MLVKPGASDELYFGSLRNIKIMIYVCKSLYNFSVYILNNVRTIVFMISKNTIPYIGTEILYETCDGHNSTQNAPKSMIPVRVCTDFCVDSESAIKTRFKALFKNLHPWIRRCCFSWNFAPGGRLSHEAYKVKKNINAECQTKEYKCMFK